MIQPTPTSPDYVEDVQVEGHIIDSLLLPKILDEILTRGGSYVIRDIQIGQRQADPSHARIEVKAGSIEKLREILDAIHDHGAVPVAAQDCTLAPADMDGAFPEGFYSTTNYRTQVRLARRLDRGRGPGDGLRHPGRSRGDRRALRAHDRRALGDRIVVGRQGLRVLPAESLTRHNLFEFMASPVSSEKPKGVTVREIAASHEAHPGGRREDPRRPRARRRAHRQRRAHLPADPRRLSQRPLRRQRPGHARHRAGPLRHQPGRLARPTACRPRRGTSIICGPSTPSAASAAFKAAVERGILKSGIMYECVRHNIPFVLAGSIRDDGPLPEVITDVLEAQGVMRELIRGVGFCLMMATMLHSIATGNLLPAWVKVACVDINPATVTKLTDRGSIQTVGVVTDAEPFLRALVHELEKN